MSTRPRNTLSALALGLVLTACQPATPPAPAAPAAQAEAHAEAEAPPAAAASASPVATPVAATAPAPACPHPEFDTFLRHFSHEIVLQEASVADPLVSEHVDTDAEPEPRMVSERIALRDVTWPVMPNTATLHKVGREMQVTREQDGSMSVLIRTPDTSDQQRYFFAQRPCWQLVRKVDEAI